MGSLCCSAVLQPPWHTAEIVEMGSLCCSAAPLAHSGDGVPVLLGSASAPLAHSGDGVPVLPSHGACNPTPFSASGYEHPGPEEMEAFQKTREKAMKTGNFGHNSYVQYFVSLYMAIRSSNWTLRVASITEMAPMFAACDRQHYHRLIPQHLADLATMPSNILSELQRGQFTVSIKGRPVHDVAVDEAHEMLVNKDIKRAVVRPTALHLKQTAQFCQYRLKT